MSVLEPDTTAAAPGIEIDPPDFPVVVRGYDRRQVDAYLRNVVSRLAAEHERAARAEQEAANDQRPTFEHLSAEAIKVLELASRSGKALIEQAKKQGESIVQEAEGRAADLLEEADQQAERLHAAARGTLREAAEERDRMLAEANEQANEIRTLAQDDARATRDEAQSASQQMWQTVLDECSTLQAETKRLQELRDRTMEHLTRVRTELNSSLFDRPPEGDPDDPPVLDASIEEVPDGTDAMANAGAEPAASAESAEHDPAFPAQGTSDK
jgi:DivIVA domain-containing protein